MKIHVSSRGSVRKLTCFVRIYIDENEALAQSGYF